MTMIDIILNFIKLIVLVATAGCSCYAYFEGDTLTAIFFLLLFIIYGTKRR